MSEAIWICIITNATTLALVLIGRLWSRAEHYGTAEKIEEVHKIVKNGHGD